MSFVVQDRASAGRDLARALLRYRKHPDVLVLALPRGGVPVAAEVARELHAPLDILVVRKLGTPGHEELAMGAIASGGIRVLNPEIVESLGIEGEVIEEVAAREQRELDRRLKAYRGDREWPEVEGRRVILVDDGISTGATLRAAIAALRAQQPARVIVAAPVAPAETLAQLRRLADEVVCLATPEPFYAIGRWYASFPQVSDDEVGRTLSEHWSACDVAAHAEPPHASRDAAPDADLQATRQPTAPAVQREEVRIRVGAANLAGSLALPEAPRGLAVLVHGSGSSRFSRRNRQVAESLAESGLATLLFDLLTEKEEQIDARTGELRFDIALLTERLIGVLEWLEKEPTLRRLPVGLFGASTGAAAAINAAAARPRQIAAVVSRGGRPDLAHAALGSVRAPTLFIVGGLDEVVIALNQRAAARLRCEHRLEIVAGAAHLFEESGKLEEVARLARDWFARHLHGADAPIAGEARA